MGAALLARKNKLNVFVSDYGTISEEYKKDLIDNDIPFEEKGHSFEIIDRSNLIVKSPGIPPGAEVLKYALSKGKKVISEIEFAYCFNKCKIIGITGTNGKTTSSTMCHHLLSQSDLKVGLGGNVGVSFSRILASGTSYDWLVLELSSFQLEMLDTFKAEISCILNITPDHLDRYDNDFSKYASAKWNLPLHTARSGTVILNGDDPTLRKYAARNDLQLELIWVDKRNIDNILSSKETGLNFDMNFQGQHMMFNASVSVLIARKLGLSEAMIQKGLNSFQPVAHRLELFVEDGLFKYINDSKSTNVESSIVALDAMDAPVVWIAGGTDKGNDYQSLTNLVNEKVIRLICLTKDDSKLRDAFKECVSEIYTTENIDEAVRMAINGIKRATILLSPACASFDLFNNYEDRGNRFKEAVHKLLNESSK